MYFILDVFCFVDGIKMSWEIMMGDCFDYFDIMFF